MIADGTAAHCTGEQHIAKAFWNAEVESDLRVDDIDFKFTEKSDREAFMDESDYSICTHKLFRGV